MTPSDRREQAARRPFAPPWLLLVVSVAAVSSSSILTLAATAPVWTIAAWRLALAALLFSPFAVPRRREFGLLTTRERWLVALSGVLLAFHFGFWIASLQATTVLSSTVLVSAHPLVVLVLEAMWLHQRTPRSSYVAGALSVLGMLILGFSDGGLGAGRLGGDALAFLGALAMAGYLLIGRAIRPKLSVFPYTTAVYTVAVVALVILSRLQGEALIGFPAWVYLIFLALALGPTFLGHTALNYTLAWVPASAAAIAVLGEPVGAALLAFLFFGQVPTTLEIIGSALILSGMAIYALGGRGRRRTATEPSF